MIAMGRLPPVPDKLQWHLPPGGNRTPLKGVTVNLYPLSPQSRGPASLLLRVDVAHETTNSLGLQMMHGAADLSPIDNRLRVPKPLNLGSTDLSSHCGAVLLGGEEENL